MSTGKILSFKGWWSGVEKKDCSTPWEIFEVVLAGLEAGDVVESKDVQRVLSIAGYELILRKV